MDTLLQIQVNDNALLARVAAAMDNAVKRGGAWIACKPGCTGCCMGPFAITAMDAARLKRGMAHLVVADPLRAEAVRVRAEAYMERIKEWGTCEDVDSLPEELDDAPCPALDVSTGLCDLYETRPLTCRVFGPATRIADGPVGACELCFAGAPDEQIEQAAVDVAFVEDEQSGGTTIVACALVG